MLYFTQWVMTENLVSGKKWQRTWRTLLLLPLWIRLQYAYSRLLLALANVAVPRGQHLFCLPCLLVLIGFCWFLVLVLLILWPSHVHSWILLSCGYTGFMIFIICSVLSRLVNLRFPFTRPAPITPPLVNVATARHSLPATLVCPAVLGFSLCV